MSNKNAVIVSIKDYELLCSNNAKFLKDYNIFLVRGSGQNADLKGTYRELIVDNPDDGQMILTAFKEILKEDEMKDNLLVFFGKIFLEWIKKLCLNIRQSFVQKEI